MDEMILKDILPDVYERIEKYGEQSEVTGFSDIDELMHNFTKGIVTIAGRPAMGKTSFVYSIIEQLANKKKKILLFSLETPKEMTVQRILCINAEIDSMHIRSGNMLRTDWEKLADSMGKMAEWDLYINDKSLITPDEIENSIKELKPDYVCIDYLQLINLQSKKDRNFQIEDIMQSLSKIAKDNEVIIFLLSQLTRATEERIDKRPLLSDLRGSSAIETISDVVMLLYRPEYYACDDETIRKGDAEIIVAKNKLGATGVIRMTFNSCYSKFTPMVRGSYEF